MNIKEAKALFKDNFIGLNEIKSINNKLKINLPNKNPELNIKLDDIDPNEYILILGTEELTNSKKLNIKEFVKIFGYQYDENYASFYNQDWYLEEEFVNKGLSNKWYLIQKYIPDNTRGFQPSIEAKSFLPSAILCVYTFFIWSILRQEYLWGNDYVWCSDIDRHGDQIYVGKYHDLDNLKRSGFSIHRHLSIKNNYGVIKSI